MPKLREAVSEDVFKRHNQNVSPKNILIVPGGKVIIFFAAMLMGEKNKEILYPNPGFPIYESAINYSGAKAIPYELTEKKGFSFFKQIAKTRNPRKGSVYKGSTTNIFWYANR